MKNIAVLASHNGSALDILHNASKNNILDINISLVISNNTNSPALQKADKYGIKNYLVNSKTDEYPDSKIFSLLKESGCEYIFLSGYMKKLSPEITNNFKVINSHPSLLPKYGGVGMYGKFVHEAVIKNKESISGVTIHEVNEIYDDGKIILQKELMLNNDESAESLELRIKELEESAIIEGLRVMFEIAEYIGIIAFAMSGFFVAVRNKLDLLGILISTFLTALGGGILRDIAVDRVPFTFSHNYPAIIVITVMLILIFFKFHRKNSLENKPLFIFSDSIGLISFSITGALIALENNFNLTGVLAMAFVTAVGGGIARDVIINEIPFVLKTGFYGTISLFIGVILYVLEQFNLISFYSISILFFLALSLRIVAFYKKWSIPLK